jgi:hypothetical protein
MLINGDGQLYNLTGPDICAGTDDQARIFF